MISVADYFNGLDKTHEAELTDEIRHNAVITTERANRMISAYQSETGDVESRYVVWGWRPQSVNAELPGASPISAHMDGQAIDISDPGGNLDEWCMDNLQLLERFGLWLEHPSFSKNICHVQTVPPKSGRRVYFP